MLVVLSSVNPETKITPRCKTVTNLSWVIYMPAKMHVISIECLEKNK